MSRNNIRSYSGRAFIDKDTALRVIGPEMLKDFTTCFNRAWEKYNRVFRPHNPLGLPKSIASSVRELTLQEVRERIADRPGVRISEPYDRFLLEIHETVLVQFRKIGPDFSTSNNPTATSRDFDGQLELPGITLPRLIAGYQPNKFWTGPSGLFLAFNVGSGTGANQWWYNLVTAEHSGQYQYPMQPESAADREARKELQRRLEESLQANPEVS